ncbi:MAG TPA: NAD(P)-dependent oxidoreductase [Candidatus Eremiobacteraceae bacterium]|nr:NAD(P)-dependent oxidoreductase [Candidatus Eremiobacteraceae bacterium]
MAYGRRHAPAMSSMKVVSLSPSWLEDLNGRLDEGIALVAADPRDAAGVGAAIADAQVILATRFDAEMARNARALELLICPAAGTEMIDRSALPIGVEFVAGIGHEIPMAEYVLGALVALRQRFFAADAALRRGEWRFGYFGSRELVDELWGSSLGLVGFGRIGEQVALRAVAFGMQCRAVTLHPDKAVKPGLLAERPAPLDSKAGVDALIGQSDALVVACALSPLTQGLIDARRFELMRPHAVLVNVARGPVVDERALFDALSTRRIAGAAIDVWYRYPHKSTDIVKPSDMAFDALDNVIMTPHSSAWTPAARERRIAYLASTINDHAANRSRR